LEEIYKGMLDVVSTAAGADSFAKALLLVRRLAP